jgi:hypothetical protein
MNPRHSHKKLLKGSSSGPASAGPLLRPEPGDTELAKAQYVCLPMTDRNFDGRSGSRHYGRWSYPWRSEDEWGPITAAVVFLIILVGLIVSGGGLYL